MTTNDEIDKFGMLRSQLLPQIEKSFSKVNVDIVYSFIFKIRCCNSVNPNVLIKVLIDNFRDKLKYFWGLKYWRPPKIIITASKKQYKPEIIINLVNKNKYKHAFEHIKSRKYKEYTFELKLSNSNNILQNPNHFPDFLYLYVRPMPCDKCVICLDNIPEVIYMPCGHFSLCYGCHKEHSKASTYTRCPICRELVLGVRAPHSDEKVLRHRRRNSRSLSERHCKLKLGDEIIYDSCEDEDKDKD